jgi:hypothetical protein
VYMGFFPPSDDYYTDLLQDKTFENKTFDSSSSDSDSNWEYKKRPHRKA